MQAYGADYLVPDNQLMFSSQKDHFSCSQFSSVAYSIVCRVEAAVEFLLSNLTCVLACSCSTHFWAVMLLILHGCIFRHSQRQESFDKHTIGPPALTVLLPFLPQFNLSLISGSDLYMYQLGLGSITLNLDCCDFMYDLCLLQ